MLRGCRRGKLTSADASHTMLPKPSCLSHDVARAFNLMEGTMPPWKLAFPHSNHEVFVSEINKNTGKETMTSVLGE